MKYTVLYLDVYERFYFKIQCFVEEKKCSVFRGNVSVSCTGKVNFIVNHISHFVYVFVWYFLKWVITTYAMFPKKSKRNPKYLVL